MSGTIFVNDKIAQGRVYLFTYYVFFLNRSVTIQRALRKV